MKPKTLQDAIKKYSDEQTCIDTVASLRWPEGKPVCPACGHTEHYWLGSQKRWKCKDCYKQFTVKLGTIFEDSPLSLTKWLPALWMLVNCKNGISSYELGKDLGVSQKSAWFMLHRLRLALKNSSLLKLGSEGGPVEADETFVGAKTRTMHKSRLKKIRAAQNLNVIPSENPYANKTVVFGMLDREARKVRAMVVPNIKRSTLQDQILNNIQGGSTVYTDEYAPYKQVLSSGFVHDCVNHMETYVKGQVHTQGIENFWSLLKRGLRGTYVAVEPFHLDRYIDEQVFRFNNRGSKEHKVTDSERFEIALSQIAGKRLTFAEVTGKGTPTQA
ncbi:MAG TPA: IS1595 family transposase [Terriglobales bacterium]|nr:IS1595 family transposase [Terriglobales bacterium]